MKAIFQKKTLNEFRTPCGHRSESGVDIRLAQRDLIGKLMGSSRPRPQSAAAKEVEAHSVEECPDDRNDENTLR